MKKALVIIIGITAIVLISLAVAQARRARRDAVRNEVLRELLRQDVCEAV